MKVQIKTCVTKYTKTYTDGKTGLVAMMLMALIVEDDHSKLLDKSDTIQDLVHFLDSATQSPQRKYEDLGTVELTQALEKLAVNDDNKLKVINEGALKPLLALLKNGTAEEKEASANCLWTLSFREDGRIQIISTCPEIVTVLEDLEKSSQTPVSVRKSVQFALWNLKHKDQLAAKVYNETCHDPALSDSKGYIFLSYCWAQQELVLKIHKRLVESSYNVWIDILHMKGSTVDAMAEGVSNASLVFICVSDDYYKSRNCRSEAMYADKCRKEIVPLVVQKEFTPKKWLDFLMLQKKYYNFCGKDSFEETFKDLLKDIGPAKEEQAEKYFEDKATIVPKNKEEKGDITPPSSLSLMDETDGSENRITPRAQNIICSISESASSKQEEVTLKRVKRKDGLSQWLKAHGLQRLETKLKRWTVDDFWDLQKIKRTAPETFYKCLKEEMELTLLEMIRFDRALAEI